MQPTVVKAQIDMRLQGFQIEADSLSAELLVEFPEIETELFPEGKGIFDVVANGATVFSKYEVLHFPESGEIIRHLKP